MNDWVQLILAVVLIGTVLVAASHTGQDDWPESEEEWESRQW